MTQVLDRTNQQFSLLKVISRANNLNGRVAWNCLCQCGKTTVVLGSNLGSSAVKSCGCLRAGHWAAKRTGILDLPLYKYPENSIWFGMISRCHNPSGKNYRNYGGRGIYVSEEWRNSFEQFYKDMGPRPSILHSLERIDNSKGYFASNVKWATRTEQNNNTRKNVMVTYHGEAITFAQAMKKSGTKINRTTLQERLDRGWPVDMAFDTPRLKGGHKRNSLAA